MKRSVRVAFLTVLLLLLGAAMLITRAPSQAVVLAQSGDTATPTTGSSDSSRVWNDLNHDGIQDESEPGLVGINVQLWNPDQTQLISIMVTDASGYFGVVAPQPGEYRVRVILPGAVDIFSPKDNTTDDTLDSDINGDITLLDFGFSDVFSVDSSNADEIDIDAGIVHLIAPTQTPIYLGDFVWNDLNEDGLQDEDELGLVGIPVQLWNSDQSRLLYETMTDEFGRYTLVAPEPGQYRVRVVEPEGSFFSIKDVFDNSYDGLDSDINPLPEENNFGFSDVFYLSTASACIISIDAGLRSVPPTPTPTYTPSAESSATTLPTATLLPTMTPDLSSCSLPQPAETLEGFIVTDTPQPFETSDTEPTNDTSVTSMPSVTALPTETPLPSATPTELIPSDTPSPSATFTNTPTEIVIQEVTETETPTNTPTVTATFTATFTPTITSTFSPTFTPSNTPTDLPPGVTLTFSHTPTRTPTPINVGNFVWDDIDQDGRQDAGEPGLAGVTVQLWNSAKTLLIDSTTTSASGIYTLVAPLPGSYRVRVILPNAGDEFSPQDQAGGDDLEDSDINPSGTNAGFTDIYIFGSSLISITSIDAGIIVFRTPTPTRTPTPINIGNFVWDDLDQDGRQDAGEPGIAGVTIQLWNSAKTQLIDSATTNASGIYTVTAPLPGNYRIRVLLPTINDSFSPMDQAGGDNQEDSDINPSGSNFGFTDVFNLASNVISTTIMDAGIIVFHTPTPTRTPTPINIGNFIWDDIDQDGRQDAGEPGLGGVTVQLWNSAKTMLIDDALTSGSGVYVLVAPVPGDYRIRVILPGAGDQFSPKDQAGGDNQEDSDINPSGLHAGFTDVFNLASNVISTTIMDAGIIVFRTPTPTRTPTPINLGNFIWNDLDEDGAQDAGEPGIANVNVQLWNAAKTLMIDATVTNDSGIYTLVAPLPGDYRIRVVLPSVSDSFSLKDQAGGDDLEDSDINPSGINGSFTDVISIASNVISITSIDAGISRPLTFQPLATAIILPLVASATPVVNPLPPPPTATQVIQRVDCAGFRLTAPLDGLPNGIATFYWDPVNAQSISYRVTVMDEGRNVLTSADAGSSTNVSLDVSQPAIGGQFQFYVQVAALSNGRVVCSDERFLLREAGGAPPPQINPQPTETGAPPPRPTDPPPQPPTATPCPVGRVCQ